MKKLALIMGLALVALASCTKDIVKEINNGLAIDFRVSTQTRAEEVTNGTLRSFFVTAISVVESEENVYFSDIEFKLQGTLGQEGNYFTSDDKYYWPAAGKLDFYAYYPSELVGELTISDEGKELTEFQPAAEISDQVDFIVAKASGTKANQQDGIELVFNHMLSQVEIMAKNSNSEYSFVVGGVAIKGVKTTGDFNFADLTWNLDNTTSDYSVDYSSTDGISLGLSGISVMGEGIGTAMLLPQDLSDVNAELEVLVNITRNSETEGVPGTQVFPETDKFGAMSIPIDTKWEPGYKYVYTLDLTGSLGQPIQFTMDVVPWNEEALEVPGEIDIIGKWRMSKIEIKAGQSEPDVYTYPDRIKDYIPDEVYIVDVISDNKYVNLNNEMLDFKIYDNKLWVQFAPGYDQLPYDIISLSENAITYSEYKPGENKKYIYTYTRENPGEYDLTGTWQIWQIDHFDRESGRMVSKSINEQEDLQGIAMNDVFRIAIVDNKYYFSPGVREEESTYFEKESTFRIVQDRLFVIFPEDIESQTETEFIIETINSWEAIYSTTDGSACFYYKKQSETPDILENRTND